MVNNTMSVKISLIIYSSFLDNNLQKLFSIKGKK